MSAARDRYVLAVSEDTAYLSVLKLSMRTLGFSGVHAATSVAGALRRLEEREYDLIVSDWSLEPLDGLDLLRIVKQAPEFAEIPFILMAVEIDEIAWREALALGVADFLAKPLTLASLRAACAHSLRPAEPAGGNVVALRPRLQRARREREIAAALSRRPPAEPLQELNPAESESGRLRSCYELIRRLIYPQTT